MKIYKLIGVFLFFNSCVNNNENHKKQFITIEGKLENLPNGTLNIVNLKRDILATTKTKEGLFKFNLNSKNFPEPILVCLEHYDSFQNKRLFIFQTNPIPNSKLSGVGAFMLEDGIKINGKIVDLFQESKKIKTVLIDKMIVLGNQTEAYFKEYNVQNNYPYWENVVDKYPYSYHLLYELQNKTNLFNDEQLTTLFELFDDDVQNSKTGKELKLYIENRGRKKLSLETISNDREGNSQTILEKSSSLNMVILWASWCGPCRMEIPELKKIHQEFLNNKNFSMVSVSLDDNKDLWIKALEKEKMPWKQLILSTENRTYSKELFSYNGSIPTILFIDSKGSIIKKYIGYDKSRGNEFETMINKYTSNSKLNIQ
jgi:thiol-disulfide isomerase/thioredoxin